MDSLEVNEIGRSGESRVEVGLCLRKTLLGRFRAHGQAFVTQLLFYKNIAVAGGLLALVASGAGGWSLEARNAPARAGLAAA